MCNDLHTYMNTGVEPRNHIFKKLYSIFIHLILNFDGPINMGQEVEFVVKLESRI